MGVVLYWFLPANGDSRTDLSRRVAEYHELGIDEFILSGYPHLEEAYRVGEGLMPGLRRRGLLAPAGTKNDRLESVA